MAQSAIQQRLELRKQCANHEEYVQKREEQDKAEKENEIQALLLDTLAKSEIPENNFWDEVENTYQTAYGLTVEATHELASAISKFKDDAQAAQRCDDYPRLIKLINQVSHDTEIYLKELDGIHATHEGKNGPVVNGEELLVSEHAQRNYTERMQIFHTITNPNVTEIHQLIGTIDKAIEEMKQRELQDPTAISTVNFTEQSVTN